jgi:hypothetical protein
MVKEKKFLSLKFATGPFEISPRARSTLGIATHVTPVLSWRLQVLPRVGQVLARHMVGRYGGSDRSTQTRFKERARRLYV